MSLQEVGKLFDHLLSCIRDDLDQGALEPMAIAWLKDARYNLMRDIETKYYELARARGTPSQLPTYVDPSYALYMETECIPTVLLRYQQVFIDNLDTLMKDCGFKDRDVSRWATRVQVTLRFPVRPRVASAQGPIPRTLHIEDQFSTDGPAFSGTNLARLIEDAQLGSAAENTEGGRDCTPADEEKAADDVRPKSTGATQGQTPKKEAARQESTVPEGNSSSTSDEWQTVKSKAADTNWALNPEE
ncbi:hypothetical protein DFH07DRAFT_1009912 [Mycena maculata]|uniref:Uncharacterized protein n=1 Tax=Mycena maculata TaxID=230809 RepID=A0AAD7MJD3_9AGAR|nr:hypothetical protein DFH07DRAFT_1009912 [Mycena maculata]